MKHRHSIKDGIFTLQITDFPSDTKFYVQDLNLDETRRHLIVSTNIQIKKARFTYE